VEEDSWSVKQQKRSGAYERNQHIRAVYKKGMGQKLADDNNISRARINQIVHREEK